MIKILLFSTALIMVSCTKVAGPGGSSSIRGKVVGTNYSAGQQEISQIMIPLGSQVEHGDYWTFNDVNNTNQFYVYYKHPNWISDADPHLVGKQGIPVLFDYNQSNLTIAQNTYGSLQLSNIEGITISINNDILTLTNEKTGYTMDADNGNSNVSVDIINQGKPAVLSDPSPMSEYKVYLIYGSNAFYSQDTRTNAMGEFSFDGYKTGNYRVYVISEDTLSQQPIELEQEITVSQNKTIYTLSDFYIIH